MSTSPDRTDLNAIVAGLHKEPFSILGQHVLNGRATIRTFQPTAAEVALVKKSGEHISMLKIHEQGLFELQLDQAVDQYRLSLTEQKSSREIIDPYCLPSAIGELDRHLISEGTHQQLYRILGSHVTMLAQIEGVHFAVWAPNALRVSVVGDFNHWDGRVHVMRHHTNTGIWDIFVPDIGNGALYKFEILAANGELLPLKHDPYAPYFEQPPGNASIVFSSHFEWSDASYLTKRQASDPLRSPLSVYEVHADSWRNNDNGDALSYRQMTEKLIPYVVEQHFTHIELMPITEHPFTGSWGYQPIGMYAPTSRFGSPDDFRYFVDCCHQANIGVIIDWVPAHFPKDQHGLGQFDGTHLYEHADPRQGVHQDWDTLIYNYGRREVANYLYSNAVFWIREFHIDGLRVDAVASMLYLDYSREAGQWIPNEHGGRENLQAIVFLKRMNELVHAEGGITLAEESTSFPGVSHPIYNGGLGFTFKWNMGWMHDMLDYMSKDPTYRKYHQNLLTFGMLYLFSENFILPFSHDEVVHGKKSMINKMPGDDWQKFANLRSCYAMMFTYPGKKLLFMGNEIAQSNEWQHNGSLQWHLLENTTNKGIQDLIRDLNTLYLARTSLFETDCDSNGFEWIDCDDAEQSVISYYRYSQDRQQATITVCNFTPVVRHGYQVGVNTPGQYLELLNTDADCYAGSGQGNMGKIASTGTPMHNRPHSLMLTLPPLSVLILMPDT